MGLKHEAEKGTVIEANGVTITVLRGSPRLEITAPPEVAIHVRRAQPESATQMGLVESGGQGAMCLAEVGPKSMDDPFLVLRERARLDAGRAGRPDKTKVILCFDDGSAESCPKIASLFEARNLRAVFAVMSGLAKWGDANLGNWEMWNQLQKNGHWIHPHSHDHVAFGELTFDEARASATTCLESFSTNLTGFESALTCFHYPHNDGSNAALNEWLLGKVAGIRMAPQKKYNGYNALEHVGKGIFYCTTHPKFVFPAARIDDAKRDRPYAWIIALHGVDGVGWKPVSQNELGNLLDGILSCDEFDCLNRL